MNLKTHISAFYLLATFLMGAQIYGQESVHHCSQKAKFYNLQNNMRAGANLGTEAYDVHFYKLDLHLERNTTFIEGNVTIAATVGNAGLDTFVFELHSNHTIDSLFVNGQLRTPVRIGQFIHVPLTSTLSAGSAVRTQIFYHGTAPSGGSAAIGQGFTTGSSPSWGNEVTWSLSQPFSAYEWFPVKQDLEDKADSSEVWIETDSLNKAGSNGILEAVVKLPNGKVQYQWKSRYPIAYYLISVAVAKYVDYTIYAKPSGQNDSVKIVNYIYDNPGTLPNFKDEIDKTADMLDIFSEKFGMYPFQKEKYGHCMAPFSGGMEHQTMTSQGYFVTDLTSHELGHQWFGDDVTCASWKDIFLNEGFASYLEYVYIQAYEPARADAWINSTHNSALNPNGSVYVDDITNVSRIFSSSLSYNKGAFLLHMLRYEINDDDVFYAGLKNYRQQYTGKNATGMQFKASMEAFTSMDFTDFFDQWYFGEGYPTFNFAYNQDIDYVYLRVDQQTTAPNVTPFFKTPLDVRLVLGGANDTVVRLEIDQQNQTFKIPNVKGNLAGIFVDEDQWILNGEGSAFRDPSLGWTRAGAEEAWRIYPNPTSDQLFITGFSEQFEKMELSDVRGNLVYRSDKPAVSVDVSSFSPGTYFLNIYQNNQVFLRKVVVGSAGR